jgi:hypothetical protein
LKLIVVSERTHGNSTERNLKSSKVFDDGAPAFPLLQDFTRPTLRDNVFYKCCAEGCMCENAYRGPFSTQWKRAVKYGCKCDLGKILQCTRKQKGTIMTLLAASREYIGSSTANTIGTISFVVTFIILRAGRISTRCLLTQYYRNCSRFARHGLQLQNRVSILQHSSKIQPPVPRM